MEKIITSGEFWALMGIIAVLFTLLEFLRAEKEFRNARRNFERMYQKAHDDAERSREVTNDEIERRRMVHEADSYNEACVSMEPFCGEGKKP